MKGAKAQHFKEDSIYEKKSSGTCGGGGHGDEHGHDGIRRRDGRNGIGRSCGGYHTLDLPGRRICSSENVDGLIKAFNEKYPNVNVTVEYLDYTNGDDQVNTAIEGGQAPDLVLEGPERLVANWGARD